MIPILGHGLWVVELCKALGIDPGRTTGFELRVFADEAIELKVTSLVEEGEVTAFGQALKKHVFVLCETFEGPASIL